jgi:hypothetical protein
MKAKIKITNRERWIIALAPSILIGTIYLYGFYGGLEAALEKQQKRVAAASILPKPAGISPMLAKAKADQDEVNRNINDRQARLGELDAQIAAAQKDPSEDKDAAQLIQRVEAIFAHSGITPLVSEPADEGDAATNAPTAILDVLAPKTSSGHRDGRIWHCVFDDHPAHFEAALKQVEQDLPAVVPISMNLVYNPTNFGETHLLELWLLY